MNTEYVDKTRMLSKQEVKAWLIARIAVFANASPEKISTSRKLTAYGLDSVEMVQLSGEIEEWLGLTLSPVIAWNNPTIDALTDYLIKNYQENA